MMRPVHAVLLVAIVMLTTFTTLALTDGCGAAKPIVTDVIDCAKAEAVVVGNGYSIMQIVVEVVAAIKGGPTAVIAEVEKLIAAYGSDIVACAIDNFPEPAVVPASSGALVTLSADQAVLNKHMVLSTLFAGKKITHTFRKHTP